MAVNMIHLRAIVDNQDAIEALADAFELLEDIQEDVPWKEELEELKQKLYYVTKNIDLVGAIPVDDVDVDCCGLCEMCDCDHEEYPITEDDEWLNMN